MMPQVFPTDHDPFGGYPLTWVVAYPDGTYDLVDTQQTAIELATQWCAGRTS